MPAPINFNSYDFTRAEEREVLAALRSGWITTGPRTERFEAEFAAYVGGRFGVGVTSGTAALHLALLALEIGPGDEVITTPMTFAATVNAILYVGARPVLVDVEPDTLNLDPERVARAVTRRTRAILPVHYAGQPCRMKALLAIARRHRLRVIQDAAHAIETLSGRRRLGGMGDAACYSFHPIKNITTGEGGMVVTRDRALAERLRSLRLHGMNTTAWKRYAGGRFRHWDAVALGYKYNMTDIQAALGLQQLRRIDDLYARRCEHARLYDELLGGEPGLELLPRTSGGDRSAHDLYVVRVVDGKSRLDRDALAVALKADGIGVGVHFRAVHHLSYHARVLKVRRGSLPHAERASDRILSLPLYPKMTRAQVRRVARTVARLVRKGA